MDPEVQKLQDEMQAKIKELTANMTAAYTAGDMAKGQKFMEEMTTMSTEYSKKIMAAQLGAVRKQGADQMANFEGTEREKQEFATHYDNAISYSQTMSQAGHDFQEKSKNMTAEESLAYQAQFQKEMEKKGKEGMKKLISEDARIHNLEVYKVFKQSVEEDPTKANLEYHHLDYEIALGMQAREDLDLLRPPLKKLSTLLDESMKEKKPIIHNFWMYIISKWYSFIVGSELEMHNKKEDQIRDDLIVLLNKTKKEPLSKQEKTYAKFLLCWCHRNGKHLGINSRPHYEELKKVAGEVGDVLAKPLVDEYNRLTNEKSPLMKLALAKHDACDSKIVSNREILHEVYEEWYGATKELDDKATATLREACNTLGFNMDWARITKTLSISGEHYITCDEMALELLNHCAVKLNPSFQGTIKEIYAMNRAKMSLDDDVKESDCGVLSGPVKNRARQRIKVQFDYNESAPPKVYSVLDIVRCAVVFSTDVELCGFFEMFCERFRGNIVRVKNAFDDPNKHTFGYRAVLINVVFEDTKVLPKPWKIICEVQLILDKYYQVRKSMHLLYSILRSDTAESLAQDACKLGASSV